MENQSTLKVLRTDKTMTQGEIAEIIGCSRMSYIDYESGRRSIPLKMLITLAAYYNVSADFILGRTHYKSPYPTFPNEAILGETPPEVTDTTETPHSPAIGSILKSLRESHSLTQKQVAEFLGCTQEDYCCYESGKRVISAKTAIMLSVCYNVSVDYLLGLTYRKRAIGRQEPESFEHG